MRFKIKTNKREEIVNITEQVKKVLPAIVDENSRMCLVYVPHTSCGILINEGYDPDVNLDILDFLKKNIPREGWKHSEGNSDAHIKSTFVGPSKIIPVENCKLMLGKWQKISFCEFDGPREREVVVEVV